MIGRLRGIIIEKQPPLVLIEVGGVGYEVLMPMTCFYELPEAGQEAIVFTHFVVREDAQLLYGFNNKQERTLFKELIKTNGVGPKLALAILSDLQVCMAISLRQPPSWCSRRLPARQPTMLNRKRLLRWWRWAINHKKPAAW